MAEDGVKLHIGTIQEYRVNGPWGRIVCEDQSEVWFHEELAFVGGQQLEVGSRVEFRARFQERLQVWQALSVRQYEMVETVEPETKSGVVKVFNLDKGYGFITAADGGPDVFVHQSRIVGDGFRYLLPGEPVLFEVEFDDKKDRYQALSVRPPESRQRGNVKNFNHAKGFGFIRPASGGDDIFFHHSSILSNKSTGRNTAEEGEGVWYEVERRAEGRSQAVRVKRDDSRVPLLRFADMGPENDWLSTLAGKVEKEAWQHGSAPNQHTDYPILKSFMTYTFERLEQEDRLATGKKIAVGRDGNKPYACFNTGLVTSNQEEVFALFSGKSAVRDGRNWKLEGFHAASDHEMLGKFEALPELANYFDDPTVLLYDRRCDLYIDIDHVVDDNIGRFPAQLKESKYLARQSLIAARAMTQQRVYRNYKTAVPQFHRGEVQLLLPLCLLKPTAADLALVVSRNNRQYRGETILTLDMAYNNARLLSRPDSDWLEP